MNHLTYITANISTLGSVDFSQIQETGIDPIRKSLDDTQFVAKWDGDTPETINNIPDADKSEIMNSDQAFTLMNTPEWTNPNPPE